MKAIPFRIAPLLVVAAVPLLGLKLAGIAAELAASTVQPASAATPAPQTPAAPATATPPAAPQVPAPAAPQVPAPASQSPVGAASPNTAASAATHTAAISGKPDERGKPASSPGSNPGSNPGAGRDPTSFSPAEVDLLQALSQRRSELDKRSDELDGREVMLKAAEQRINEKIDALKKMEQSIDEKLQQNKEENEDKIKNIVRIYEIMKPQEAARIFEQLDMPVLLDVVEHMKEQKAAPILANMQPQKAKALTLALAERRQVPKP
ncbi:MAG: hypothetical protein JO267_15665 [Alphaproteobacteria bacterium]|nr:hypothetical protein [Alphaproteobacteria bacterium]